MLFQLGADAVSTPCAIIYTRVSPTLQICPCSMILNVGSHDNSGPKFGIQMLGKGVVPTDVFPPNATTVDFCDQLHVPTPWHNCIVQIEGHSEFYITKASAIWPAIKAGDAKLVRDGDVGEYVYFKGCK